MEKGYDIVSAIQQQSHLKTKAGICRVFKIFFAIALFALCLSSLSAKMPGSVSGETKRTYRQALFFFEKTKSQGQSETIWRLPFPLYGRYKNVERAYTFHHSLYPLYYNHGTNHWRKWSVLSIFDGSDFYHKDTRSDRDFLIGPLFYIGRGDSEKERYFSFFPFFGTWKNKFSYSEMNFFLFPLYINWSYKDYKAHSILWPLTLWGSGRKRNDLRIFPFYSHKIHKGKYIKRTILWPFWQSGRVDLDKREPRSYYYIFPFYARKTSDHGNLSVHGILPIFPLPPLFSWGYDKKANAWNINLFWFLYQYGRSDSPYIRSHIIFPFWGRYQFAEKEFSFITPFYANLKMHSTIFESRTDRFGPLFVLPIYTKSVRYYLKDWRRTNFIKFWPLFQYQNDGRGNVEFRSLVLWPGRADKFEKYWGPLYNIFEYSSYENGDQYFSILFRLISRYWSEYSDSWFIFGFEWSHWETGWRVAFLGGLLGYERSSDVTGTSDSMRKLHLPSVKESPSFPLPGPGDRQRKNWAELLWFRI